MDSLQKGLNTEASLSGGRGGCASLEPRLGIRPRRILLFGTLRRRSLSPLRKMRYHKCYIRGGRGFFYYATARESITPILILSRR